jgi:hypothetical protein
MNEQAWSYVAVGRVRLRDHPVAEPVGVAFAAIPYCDLLSTVLDHACTFQLAEGLSDGWPLNTQHLREQGLGDRECVIVTAVTHHEQPTRKHAAGRVRSNMRNK